MSSNLPSLAAVVRGPPRRRWEELDESHGHARRALMGTSILLSGACGSGKSTLMTLGYRALEAHWGPTATIDTDTILMTVDPRWELAHAERRLELAGYQCGLLAESFLTAGFACVIIGGNGLHTPAEINDLVALLLELGEVYLVTLDPSLAETQRRVAARGGDKTPEWLAAHVEWMRARYRAWTCRIDNTLLDPRCGACGDCTTNQLRRGETHWPGACPLTPAGRHSGTPGWRPCGSFWCTARSLARQPGDGWPRR